MVKTLRITGVLAVILAGVFFAFPVFFGVRGDEQVTEFLNSSSILERFNQAKSSQQSPDENQSSPLVKQAEAFAQIINPPQPALLAPSLSPQPSITQRPSIVSAKFALIGTCYYQANPQQSLAFINEPGKGFHWVRQSEQVQHLIIEQIKDGLVVVRDGQRTFEIAVEQQKSRRSLLEGESVSDIEGQFTSRPIDEISNGERTTFINPPEPSMQINDKESAALEELVNKLRDLQKSFKSEKTDSASKPEDKAALMDKLISGFRSSRVSSEEARNLGDLGKTLKDIDRDRENDINYKIEK
jgi:hypothetical protein